MKKHIELIVYGKDIKGKIRCFRRYSSLDKFLFKALRDKKRIQNRKGIKQAYIEQETIYEDGEE